MRRIRASTHALRDGSDLAGTENSQRSETVGRRVLASDDDVSQVRNRECRRSQVHTPDRIEMLCGSRLIECSIGCHRCFAATQLIHGGALWTIRAAARRRGTRHRRRRTQAYRKQQSDEDYRETTHPTTVSGRFSTRNLPRGGRNFRQEGWRHKPQSYVCDFVSNRWQCVLQDHGNAPFGTTSASQISREWISKALSGVSARISEGHQLGLTIAYKTEIRDSLCLCVENYGRQAKLHDNRTQLFDRILQANWRQ
jgi:hypothetical protein